MCPVPKPRNADRDRHAPQPSDPPGVADWQNRMGGDDAKTIYKERAATAECANAQARNRGLTQFLVRSTFASAAASCGAFLAARSASLRAASCCLACSSSVTASAARTRRSRSSAARRRAAACLRLAAPGSVSSCVRRSCTAFSASHRHSCKVECRRNDAASGEEEGLFDFLPEQAAPERVGGGVPRLRFAERMQTRWRPVSLDGLLPDDHPSIAP
jgi:hypothetical protein